MCGIREVLMLEGYHPVLQSLMGTALTWGLTALGASLVLVFQGGQVSSRSGVVSCTLFFLYSERCWMAVLDLQLE